MAALICCNSPDNGVASAASGLRKMTLLGLEVVDILIAMKALTDDSGDKGGQEQN